MLVEISKDAAVLREEARFFVKFFFHTKCLIRDDRFIYNTTSSRLDIV